jgi:hypothetical protein
MKNLFPIALFLLFPVLATASDATPDKVIRLSEPVSVTETHETFGAAMPDSGDTLTLAELVHNSDQHMGQDVIVKTEIVKVCQKKGCFFIAREGEAVARVTFADYGFFIPTNSAGKMVTLAGVFGSETLTREKAEHLADDLGEPDIALAPLQYTIVASSISIPKS